MLTRFELHWMWDVFVVAPALIRHISTHCVYLRKWLFFYDRIVHRHRSIVLQEIFRWISEKFTYPVFSDCMKYQQMGCAPGHDRESFCALRGSPRCCNYCVNFLCLVSILPYAQFSRAQKSPKKSWKVLKDLKSYELRLGCWKGHDKVMKF